MEALLSLSSSIVFEREGRRGRGREGTRRRRRETGEEGGRGGKGTMEGGGMERKR